MLLPVKVSAIEDGIRLSRWLARHYPGVNMIMARKACKSGEVRINSRRCTEKDVLKTGDIVRIPPFIANATVPRPKAAGGSRFSLADLEQLRQCIIHKDSDIIAFNKTAGLATQGGGNVKKSLDKMAAALLPNDVVLAVHRLDKETSGVIVFALTQIAAQKLSRAFQARETEKEYIAVLAGHVQPDAGVIEEPIDGKKAVTEFEVLGRLRGTLSVVRFTPKTGRKHQLRKHAAFALDAPIVGDDLYGTRHSYGGLETILQTGKLHLFAAKLIFSHPRTGKRTTIVATMPDWMARALKLLEIEC